MMTETRLTTFGEVRAALVTLNLPCPPKEILVAIKASIQGKFHCALTECLGKGPNAGAAKGYLSKLLSVANAQVMETLDNRGFRFTPEVLLLIGSNEEGVAFAEAAARLARGAGAESDVAVVAEALKRAASSYSPDVGAEVNNEPAPDSYPPRESPASPRGVTTGGRGQPKTEDGEERSESGEGDGRPKIDSYHCYGGKSAICWVATTNRDGEYTVKLEGALAKGPRSYEWGEKIILMFNQSELPLLLAVLLGYRQKFEAKSHGSANNKSMFIERQNGQFFVCLNQKGKDNIAVPMVPGDAFWVLALLYRQMQKASGGLSIEVLSRMAQLTNEMSSATSRA